MSKVAVVVVTHDSQQVIGKCVRALADQSAPVHQLIVVDSGSKEPAYLTSVREFPGAVLVLRDNIGFARANNLGIGRVDPGVEYLLFLNPDAFLHGKFLAGATAVMERHPEAALLTGRLSGYDLQQHRPTGRLDSTGIFRTWYGRWYDRGQGEIDGDNYQRQESVPAVCGALMFGRRQALEQVARPGGAVFDPDFFLYKEDIELSLRLRKAGWSLLYDPRLPAFHCRGWLDKRRRMSPALRRTAAASEVLLYRRHPSPYMLWAICKYLAVNLFRA